MKRISIILFLLIPSLLYADSISELRRALNESNQTLERALERIKELENQIQEDEDLLKEANNQLDISNDLLESANTKIENVKEENEILKSSLREASLALEESTNLLEKAYDRINKDQEEIIRLRQSINDLIDAGVEFKTYNWNIMFLGGYPTNIGLAVAYNLHFFPEIGLVAGFDFNFDTMTPIAFGGIKINLE